MSGHKSAVPLYLVLIGFAVLIGLRYKVGADWLSYEALYRFTTVSDLGDLLIMPEPAFLALNWLAAEFGYEIWAVNFVSGLITVWGLGRFARTQADPWLALAVAVPYLLVVVAMGYTRQSVAIGIVLAGLGDFKQRQLILRFAAYIAIASLFHRTAVIAFPLLAMATERNRLVNLLVAIAVAFALWGMFLEDSMDRYIKNYIEFRYASQGAVIRVSMSAIAAAIVFAAGSRLGFQLHELRIWRSFSFATIGAVIALGVVPSSTAVDRLALYLIPLQIAVMARLPALFADWRLGRAAVVVLQAVVLLGWLNFAIHAQFWLPYQFYPL